MHPRVLSMVLRHSVSVAIQPDLGTNYASAAKVLA
jgi:hypothetical protein